MIIKVLVVSGNRILRHNLRSLIDKQADMQVICDAVDVTEAAEYARRLLIEVVIVDHTGSEFDGFATARQIITKSPGTKVLVLVAHSDSQISGVTFSAANSGYQPIHCPSAELANGLRKIIEKESLTCISSGSVPSPLATRESPSPKRFRNYAN